MKNLVPPANLLFLLISIISLTSCKERSLIELYDSNAEVRRHEAELGSEEVSIDGYSPEVIWFLSQPDHGFYRFANYQTLEDKGVGVNICWSSDISKIYMKGTNPIFDSLQLNAVIPDNEFLLNLASSIKSDISAKFEKASDKLTFANADTRDNPNDGVLYHAVWSGKNELGFHYFYVELLLEKHQNHSFMTLSYKIFP